MYWLLALLATALLSVVIVYSRKRKAAKEKAYLVALAAKKKETPVWGKQVEIPSQGPVCQAVRDIADVQFNKDEAPHLPLHECTQKFACQCKYRLLEERRSGQERREGIDRRPVMRYDLENPPRRSGNDRRKDKNTPFSDRAI